MLHICAFELLLKKLCSCYVLCSLFYPGEVRMYTNTWYTFVDHFSCVSCRFVYSYKIYGSIGVMLSKQKLVSFKQNIRVLFCYFPG